MSLEIKGEVHSAAVALMETEVSLGGKVVQGYVNGLVVEVLSAGHGHTFRLGPVDDDVKAWLVPGAKVTITLAPDLA